MNDIDTWHYVSDLKISGSLGSDEYVRGLAEVLRAEAWQQFTDPIQGVQTYPSFTQFCLNELGLHASAVLTMCETTTHKEAATVAAAIRHGQQLDKSEPKLRARLRKWPDLLRQVDEGLISLRQAALKAGIIKARVHMRTDNVGLAMKTAREHYNGQEIFLAQIEQDSALLEYLVRCGFNPYDEYDEPRPWDIDESMGEAVEAPAPLALVGSVVGVCVTHESGSV